jgi:hypothetical protein
MGALLQSLEASRRVQGTLTKHSVNAYSHPQMSRQFVVITVDRNDQLVGNLSAKTLREMPKCAKANHRQMSRKARCIAIEG